MFMQFDNDKKVFLAKADKSRIGEIDRDILKLVNLINSKKNYYTTSSCSGRIVLFKPSRKFKPGSRWLFAKHSIVEFNEINDCLKKAKGVLWLMSEPIILHVNCRSIGNANELLNAVKNAGLKHSGIVSMAKKIIVEIIGNERMDAPVTNNVNNDYFKFLIIEANKKLKKTKEKIKKLEKFITPL